MNDSQKEIRQILEDISFFRYAGGNEKTFKKPSGEIIKKEDVFKHAIDEANKYLERGRVRDIDSATEILADIGRGKKNIEPKSLEVTRLEQAAKHAGIPQDKFDILKTKLEKLRKAEVVITKSGFERIANQALTGYQLESIRYIIPKDPFQVKAEEIQTPAMAGTLYPPTPSGGPSVVSTVAGAGLRASIEKGIGKVVGAIAGSPLGPFGSAIVSGAISKVTPLIAKYGRGIVVGTLASLAALALFGTPQAAALGFGAGAVAGQLGVGGLSSAASSAAAALPAAMSALGGAVLGAFAVPLIVAIIAIPIIIALILFIINSGAYLVPPSEFTNIFGFDRPPIAGSIVGPCPEGGEPITEELASRIPTGGVRYLPDWILSRTDDYRVCITPTALVMHWSGGTNDNPDGNDRTYNTLVSRNSLGKGNPSCQLGTDTDDVEFWLPFYETQVENGWCSNSYNTFSISTEMAGISFTANPPPPNLTQLQLTYNSTCEIMKQYNIPWCQIYGHFEVPDSGGKTDPGRDFLYKVFIPEIRRRCPNDSQNICSGESRPIE